MDEIRKIRLIYPPILFFVVVWLADVIDGKSVIFTCLTEKVNDTKLLTGIGFATLTVFIVIVFGLLIGTVSILASQFLYWSLRSIYIIVAHCSRRLFENELYILVLAIIIYPLGLAILYFVIMSILCCNQFWCLGVLLLVIVYSIILNIVCKFCVNKSQDMFFDDHPVLDAFLKKNKRNFVWNKHLKGKFPANVLPEYMSMAFHQSESLSKSHREWIGRRWNAFCLDVNFCTALILAFIAVNCILFDEIFETNYKFQNLKYWNCFVIILVAIFAYSSYRAWLDIVRMTDLLANTLPIKSD